MEKKKFKIYSVSVNFNVAKTIEVFADSEELAEEIARTRISNNKEPLKGGTILGYATKISNVKNMVEVMDCTNCHNPLLVEKINIGYNTKRDDFLKIAQVLALRDIEECWEHNIDPNNLARFEGCVNEYLMRVADDQDLETILSYLRF